MKKVNFSSISLGENNPNKEHHEDVRRYEPSKTVEGSYPWIFIVSTQPKRAKT